MKNVRHLYLYFSSFRCYEARKRAWHLNLPQDVLHKSQWTEVHIICCSYTFTFPSQIHNSLRELNVSRLTISSMLQPTNLNVESFRNSCRSGTLGITLRKSSRSSICETSDLEYSYPFDKH